MSMILGSVSGTASPKIEASVGPSRAARHKCHRECCAIPLPRSFSWVRGASIRVYTFGQNSLNLGPGKNCDL